MIPALRPIARLIWFVSFVRSLDQLNQRNHHWNQENNRSTGEDTANRGIRPSARYDRPVCDTVKRSCWTMGTILSLASRSVLTTPPRDRFWSIRCSSV